MSRPVLLDASFIIDFDRETAQRQDGPAHRMMRALSGRTLVVSVVTAAEILEGASDEEQTVAALRRFSIQGIHLAHGRRCAIVQRRSTRLGENDAWLVATAQVLDADIVGADRSAFERLGERYLKYR